MNAISKPTYATAAVTALRESIGATHGAVRDAVSAYRDACRGLAPDADLLDALKAAGELALAAEALTAASKQTEAAARTALAQTMSEVGCPSVALPSHTVHLGTKPARVDIEDERAIPPELLRKPTPDRRAIMAAIKAGRDVPGCSLVKSNEPLCVFRSRTS